MAQKKKFYAVVRGRKPGIYTEWFGKSGAEVQVRGFQNARFKGFPTYQEAKVFFEKGDTPSSTTKKKVPKVRKTKPPEQPIISPKIEKQGITIYTDGGCSTNPGPGGYGVVKFIDGHKKELSGGFRRTTNNRMELMACIVALRSLDVPSAVTLHSDSQYVVKGITKGWAKRWRSNGWMRNKTDPAENADLWKQLLKLCEQHRVDFKWVKGHTGNPGNERCDRLATKAAARAGLPVDKNYESGKTYLQ